jgi:hypothetical protein
MRRKRSARRSIVWGLVCWLGLSTVVLVHAQVARPDVIAPGFYHRFRALRQRHQEQRDRPLWLVMGSSRLGLGYLPEDVGPVLDPQGRRVMTFNFSHNGLGPVLQNIHLKRLLREGLRPDLVVLEVMPMYLHLETAHFMTRFVLCSELPTAASYLDARGVARNALRRQLEIYPRAMRVLFPNELLHFVRMDPTAEMSPTLVLGGAEHLHDSVSATDRQAQMGLQYTAYSRQTDTFHITAGAEEALRDSLAFCRREQIDAVLLLSPETASFCRMYPAGAEAEVGAFVRRLGEQAGVQVIDARSWLAEEETYDGHHPLRHGARKFTARLHETLARERQWGEADQRLAAGPSKAAPQHSPAPTAAHTSGPSRGGS